MTLNYPSLPAAVPYGLEVQLSYNGVTLNANTGSTTSGAYSTYMYMVKDISGLDDADIRVGTEDLPAWHGEVATPGFYGGRTVTISGKIIAKNSYQLRVAQQNLREAFGQNFTEKSLVFLTGDATNGDVYLNCRKSEKLQMRESVTSVTPTRDFLITLRASDPRFLSVASPTANSGTNPANSTNISCTNNGNWSAYPTITVHGPFSANLIITNTTTGVFTKLDTSLLSTNTMIIDTAARTVRDSQNGNVLRYSYLDPASLWPTLEPGAQNIQLTGVAGGTSASIVTVTWKHAWI